MMTRDGRRKFGAVAMLDTQMLRNEMSTLPQAIALAHVHVAGIWWKGYKSRCWYIIS